MKLHASKIIKRANYTRTTTLCGRMNAASQDGMNIADDPRNVSCKLCLKKLATTRSAA